jgi:hypothetical protein
VLFGSIVKGQWVATPGPRLNSNGSGPVATTLRDLNGDGIPDLIVTNSGGTISVLPGRGEGFFDDRPQDVRTLTVPDGSGLGAPSFPGTGDVGLAPTGAGSIVSIDLDAFTVGVVFQAEPGVDVNALEALADGAVIAALSNGSVAELNANAAGQLSVSSLFSQLTTGELLDPSALEIVGSGSALQALVTNTGSDQIFVFALSVPTRASTGVPSTAPPSTAPPPSTELSPSTEQSLSLVITLLFNNEETAVPAASNAGGAGIGDAANVELALRTGAPVVVRASADDDSRDEVPDSVVSIQTAVGYDAAEKLKRLDLELPIPDSDPDGPSSRRESPDSPAAPLLVHRLLADEFLDPCMAEPTYPRDLAAIAPATLAHFAGTDNSLVPAGVDVPPGQQVVGAIAASPGLVSPEFSMAVERTGAGDGIGIEALPAGYGLERWLVMTAVVVGVFTWRERNRPSSEGLKTGVCKMKRTT